MDLILGILAETGDLACIVRSLISLDRDLFLKDRISCRLTLSVDADHDISISVLFFRQKITAVGTELEAAGRKRCRSHNIIDRRT